MFKKITRKRLEQFLSKYKTDKQILDVGAGGSAYHIYFPNRTTVDVDPDRNPDIIADMQDLPFEDDSQEMILCTEVLEHVKDPKRGIVELRRILKKDGFLVLTTRFVYPLHDTPNDYWRFTKYGLLELFKEWEVIEIVPETRAFSTIGVLLQRIAFQSKLALNKPIKLLLFVLASLFNRANFLLREEYGDIKKSIEESDIMPSGYYIVAKKK